MKSNIFIIFIISFISVLSSCTKKGLSETEIESYLGGTWLATYWQNLSEGEIPCAECWNIDSIENGKMKWSRTSTTGEASSLQFNRVKE